MIDNDVMMIPIYNNGGARPAAGVPHTRTLFTIQSSKSTIFFSGGTQVYGCLGEAAT